MNESKFHQISDIYKMPNVNEEIKLYEGQIVLEPKTLKVEGNAEVLMRFIPKLEINVDAESSKFFKNLMVGNEIEIYFPSIQITSKFMIKKSSVGKAIRIVAIPHKEPILLGTPNKATKVIFHILNFPEFYGKTDATISEKSRFERRGHVILKADGWQIRIMAVRNFKALFKSLKNEGGYVITHIGEIENLKKNDFQKEECEKILLVLHYYLSFAGGYFTGPILPIGLNKDNKRIWEEWYTGVKTEYKPTLSWFDTRHGELLEEVFPGFFKQWHKVIWNEPIETAIYWYLRSNTLEGGTDGAIILAQSALELLAYTYCVEDKNIWTYEVFKNKSASEKIKELLTSLDIPINIPSSLSSLFSMGQNFTWTGPQAFTEIRNFLVHPGQKRKCLAGLELPLVEVWKLGLWYIELILLRLFEHTGVYAERLKNGRWEGDVSHVPWTNI